ncbi:hypothetical protein SAMN04487943_103413 [Gracilibacillus orientalis]|uniref:Uncharacterized protein n=1 Tax=Gracilibacillus orientalis TaxID=334253 RepID=A0A1I4K8D4_9BACI|nr:hypothetical protein SAMN04487943_103413 [Gracilibacillus orientalis]
MDFFPNKCMSVVIYIDHITFIIHLCKKNLQIVTSYMIDFIISLLSVY